MDRKMDRQMNGRMDGWREGGRDGTNCSCPLWGMNDCTHALLMLRGWQGGTHGWMVDDGLMDGQTDGWKE